MATQPLPSADGLELLLPPNCPDPTLDTWDRHSSIAFTTATKGLRNAPGENNCFVNSAVQVFWHLDVFRRSYRRLSGHTCMGNSCIFCALKVIFTQFQFSDQASLHPDALRKALADTFANQQRFQLGHMDDAAECFENILRRIHFHIANSCSEDACTAPHCLPHRKFSLNILEKVVCPCGASSSPLKFSEMVHYVSAKALVSQARIMQETGDVLHPDRFGLLLRSANAMGDIRECPGNCGKTVQIRRTLLNSPGVVSIGLVWDSDHPSVETTTEVASSIGTTILMQDVFHSVMQDMQTLPRLQLVGLVCYYGKHYSTFVFHSKLRVWVYFDDATVREIGPRWENVVEKCSKGRYQPLLLLYANPAATPVSVETAPRKRTMAPGFGIPGGPEEESSLDRTHDSISSQQSVQHRSRTPNPEPSTLQQEMNPRARSVTPSALDIPDHRRQQSFIMAMGTKGQNDRSKHPARMVGGQAGSFDGPQAQPQSYSDYTLSTSDQYRRPTMSGFEPAQLPLTPNMKGYAADSQRRDSFNRKARETVRADVVRYSMNTQGGQAVPSSSSRHRSLSQGWDENSDNSSGDGHTIVKPSADHQFSHQPPHSYSSSMAAVSSHTPVQSGLATLPRKKKDNSQHTGYPLQYHSVSNHETSTSFSSQASSTSTLTSTPAGLPPPAPSPHHFQQGSQIDSMLGQDRKSPSSKKLKKEIRKAEKKQVKSYPSVSPSPSPSPLTSAASALPPRPPSTSGPSSAPPLPHRPDELSEEQLKYIDRRMVESVLKHQGLQRQPSTNSNSSNSSTVTVETDSIMGRLLAAKLGDGSHTTGDASLDNVSLSSHKDSGYGGSDRNSSSSTGSGTIDPCTQYFISKSMVVPRSLNTQFLQPTHQQQMVSDFTDAQVYTASLGQGDAPMSDQGRQVLYQALAHRKIMHPIKESSQEDILKLMPRIETPSPPPPPPGPSLEACEPERKDNKGGRPPPIPPKNFAAFQVSKSPHNREESMDSLDSSEVQNDFFVSMCGKADELMDRCILSETQEDLSSALRFCDGALGCLKEAMNQSDIGSKALAYAQKKHNSCLLKSRSLFKRSTAQNNATDNPGSQTGKRSSITSTDSDNSDKSSRRTHGSETRSQSKCFVPVSGQSAVPARQSPGPQISASAASSQQHLYPSSSTSQSYPAPPPPPARSYPSKNFVVSEHNHVRSGSSSSIRSSTSVPNSLAQTQQQSHAYHMTKSTSSVGTGLSTAVQASSAAFSGSSQISNNNVPLDAYGTLPRNRKHRRTSDPTGNSEVYQMYLNRQKSQQQQQLGQGNAGENRLLSGNTEVVEDSVSRTLTPVAFSGLQGDSGSRLSHSSQGSTLSASSLQEYPRQQQQQQPTHQHYEHQDFYNHQQPQHHHNGPQATSGPSAFSSPAKSKLNTNTPHAISKQPPHFQHQPQQQQQQQQQHPHLPPKPLTSSTQFHQGFQPPQPQKPSWQTSRSGQSYSNASTSKPEIVPQQPPPPSSVSGYSQPLPGHPQTQRFQHNTSDQGHSYNKLPPRPNSGQSHTYNRNLNSNSNTSSSTNSFDNYRSQTPQNNLSQDFNNLNLANGNNVNQKGRHHNGMPPPPPPARTTSNPDFANNIGLKPPPSSSSFTPLPVGPVRSAAFQAPGRVGSPFLGGTPAPQLKHATSTTGLNHFGPPTAPKPLERSSSQPDVQHLGLATSSYLDVSPSSHKLDHNNIVNPSLSKSSSLNGEDLSLQPTSDHDHDIELENKPSVRALASQFGALRSRGNSSGPPSRTRSKSESGSKKPKSVLKSKKNKNKAPRKSVTFAEEISNAGYESAAELTSFSAGSVASQRQYFSDDEENVTDFSAKTQQTGPVALSDNDDGSSNSDEAPREELACQLCRKREMVPASAYCAKCQYYMSKLVS